MSRVYLLHTQFNSIYRVNNNLINGVYNEDNNRAENAFGSDKPFCLISFQDELIVDYEINFPLNHNEYLLLISDEMYTDNEEEILLLLSKIIDEQTQVLPYFHQRDSYSAFPKKFIELYESNIVRTGNYYHSHITKSEDKKNWKNNPFYVLKKVVESTSIEDFEKHLSELERVLDDQQQTKTKTILNKKLSLLYKILGEPLLTENTFKGEEEELAQPYFDCDISDSKEDEKTARLRHLRDVLLKDVI